MFEGKFECLGENAENYKTFSFPIEKEVTKSVVTISYEVKYIDSARFMATSLSNLIDNLTERIHKINVKIVIVFLNMKVLRIF